MRHAVALLLLLALAASPSCQQRRLAAADVACYVTNADGSLKLQRQPVNTAAQHQRITVDPARAYQEMHGFGFTLTGGSVHVINTLIADKRAALLRELFSAAGEDSIGVGHLRVSIGASDLNAEPFTYDDVADAETDHELRRFALTRDDALVAMLNEIRGINAQIKVIATPWTAPRWMKTNKSWVGGRLEATAYDAYARYFVRYVTEMRARGVTVDAVTPQNEPLNGSNNPSMEMSAEEQAVFIRDHLGPAFRAAGLATRIVVWDHNCDNPAYPLAVLADKAAAQYVSGSAWHLYAGDIGALSTVHDAHPDKEILFTEQYTSKSGDFGGDLKWHAKNVLIGSTSNWAGVVMEWNLANDGNYGPHTPGGCNDCKGAVTVHNPYYYEKNVAWYVVGHAAKFVPPGSRRVAASALDGLPNVAFRTPSGEHVVIVLNETGARQRFTIGVDGAWFSSSLDAGSVGTYKW